MRHARAPVTGSLIGKAFEFLSLAILVTVVPRALGPEDYGAFALGLSIVLIASSALSLGGPSLMARFIPTASPSERPALARALVVRVGAWRLAATTALAVVALVLTLTRPSTFPWVETTVVTLALALDVGATILFQAALGLRRTWLWNFRWAVQNTVLVVATLAIIAADGSDVAVVGVAIASGGALVLIATVIGPTLVHAPSGATIPDGALHFGLLQAISGLLIVLVHRGPIVAVALVSGSATQTGYAALATGIALAATYAVWQAFLSQLPGLATQFVSDPRHSEGRARRLAWAALLALLPLTAVAAVVAGSLVPRVFGNDYAGASDAIAVGLAAVPLAPLTALGSQLLSLRLLPRLRVRSAAGGAAVFVVTAVLAVPALEAAGGTLALLLGTLASALVVVISLPRGIELSFVAASVGGVGVVLGLGFGL